MEKVSLFYTAMRTSADQDEFYTKKISFPRAVVISFHVKNVQKRYRTSGANPSVILCTLKLRLTLMLVVTIENDAKRQTND